MKGNWNGIGWAVKGRDGGVRGIFRSKWQAKWAMENGWNDPKSYIERVQVNYKGDECVFLVRALEYKNIKL